MTLVNTRALRPSSQFPDSNSEVELAGVLVLKSGFIKKRLTVSRVVFYYFT